MVDGLLGEARNRKNAIRILLAMFPQLTTHKNILHIVLSTDSLSFPRPWNQKLLDDKPDQFFEFYGTYPALLRRRLRKVWPDWDIVVSNLGRRACSVHHLTSVSRDILSWMSPDVAIIHHGIVDCWIRDVQTLERRTNEKDFTKALDDFFVLRQTISPRLPVLILGILETNALMLAKFPHQNDLIRDYNSILRSKALGSGLTTKT
jgi:hypothetical protein